MAGLVKTLVWFLSWIPQRWLSVFLRSVWDQWWTMGEPLLPHPREVEHIEKVHPAQDEHDNAKFGRNVLDAFDNVGRLGTDSQKEEDETDVYEVKADYQKMVHVISHFLIAGEGFDEKKPAVLVERARYPDRHPKTDEEIRGVDAEVGVHGFVFCYVFVGLFV